MLVGFFLLRVFPDFEGKGNNVVLGKHSSLFLGVKADEWFVSTGILSGEDTILEFPGRFAQWPVRLPGILAVFEVGFENGFTGNQKPCMDLASKTKRQRECEKKNCDFWQH